MSNIDLTTAMTRLLSDQELRAAFELDRESVARELAVAPEDLAAFRALDPIDLQRQATTLLAKRYHEVVSLLPQTVRNLGLNAKPLFWEYANEVWPTSHRRHLIDAVQFAKFLKTRCSDGLCRWEDNWLRFVLSRRRLAIYFVRDCPWKGASTSAIQILYRTSRGSPRWLAWRFRS